MAAFVWSLNIVIMSELVVSFSHILIVNLPVFSRQTML